jgi:hypothetical protein
MPDTGTIHISFTDRGEVVHQTRLRFDTYNTGVIRGQGNTWLVMGPVLDSLILPNGTLRTEGFSTHYVKELACMLLDSTLQPLCGIGCGGTAYIPTYKPMVVRMHSGAYAIASNVGEHATIGGRRISSGGKKATFYVARIVAE